MRKALIGMVLVTLVVFGVATFVQASTREEAKSMAEKAAVFMKANGKDKAVAEFNNPKGQFFKGDLYVFAMDFNGVMLAHGANQKLVGQHLMDLKDPNGKFLSKEMIELAKKGGGWLDYTWVNPATKKVQAKVSWVQKVEGQDIYIACGIWK